MPILKGTEASLSYVECFLYPVSSSINVSIFHNTWLDSFWTHLVNYAVSMIFEVYSRLRFMALCIARYPLVRMTGIHSASGLHLTDIESTMRAVTMGRFCFTLAWGSEDFARLSDCIKCVIL